MVDKVNISGEELEKSLEIEAAFNITQPKIRTVQAQE